MAGERVLGWFFELNSARGSTGFGLAPISYTELQAWAQLTSAPIEPEEIRIIKALDAEWLRLSAKENK